jgi:hypothetical protein
MSREIAPMPGSGLTFASWCCWIALGAAGTINADGGTGGR